MTDIGKGDVVEATRAIRVSSVLTGHGSYDIAPGTRAIVLQLTDGRTSICSECGTKEGVGLLLEEYPLIHRVAWCSCEWRKIGGSKGDHVAWFADYLKAAPVVPPRALERLLNPPVRQEEPGDRLKFPVWPRRPR